MEPYGWANRYPVNLTIYESEVCSKINLQGEKSAGVRVNYSLEADPEF